MFFASNPIVLSPNSQVYPVRGTANNANVTVIPAGYGITGSHFVNTTANAVTGGIKVGTTNGGTDVLTALTFGANALVTNTTLSKTIFSTTVDTTLYVQAVVAWNSANVEFVFLCTRIIP